MWESALKDHPNPQFALYITQGIKHGFRVGFDRECHLSNCSSNMISALEHPQVVNDYVEQELLLDRVVVIPQ